MACLIMYTQLIIPVFALDSIFYMQKTRNNLLHLKKYVMLFGCHSKRFLGQNNFKFWRLKYFVNNKFLRLIMGIPKMSLVFRSDKRWPSYGLGRELCVFRNREGSPLLKIFFRKKCGLWDRYEI